MKLSHLLPMAAAALTAFTLSAATRAELLPGDTALRLHTANVSNLCAALVDTPLGRCLRDPEVKEFLGNPELNCLLPQCGGAPQSQTELQRLRGEQLKLLQGEVVLGLMQGTPVKFCLAAQLTKPQYAQFKEIDEKIHRTLPEAAKFVREDFQGLEILRADNISAGQPTKTTWQTLVNDTFLFSNDRAWLEKSVIQLQTKPPANAAADYLMHVSVSGRGICALIEKAFELQPATTNTPQLVRAGDLINALKLSELREATLTLAKQNHRLRTVTRINNGRCRQGIWALTDTTPLPTDWRLPYLPADAYTYTANRLNLAAFWDALPGMLGQINPTLAASQMMFQSMLQAFGVNVTEDIIRRLESGYATFSRMEGSDSHSLLYWQLKQPAEAATTLDRLLADGSPLRMQLGERLKAAKFRGYNIYTITPETGISNAWSLATAGQFLVCGNDTMLRAALRATDTKGAVGGFYNTAAYKELLRLKPAQACSYEILDPVPIIRAYLTESKWREFRQHCEKLNEKKQGCGQLPNFGRVPPTEKIASFFGPLLSYSVATPDGWESVTTCLKTAFEIQETR
ncbi:MAG: hypothetical protein ACOYCD_04090 [Kiritimatiellia bacterium]|jgi:hypothetical protein